VDRALARWEIFLLVLGVAFYLFEFSHGIHGDGSVRYDALLATLRSGHVAPMVYSYVHPLVSAPLLLGGYLYKDGFWWICRFNAFFFLAVTYFAARESGRWPGWNAAHARRLALLLLGATMFPKHVTDYYAEVFSACTILLAILFFQRGRHALAMLAVCLSVWNTVATLVGGAFLLAFFAARSKRLRFLLVVPLLPLGFLLENWVKYGEFYPSAYVALQVGPHMPLPYAMGPGFTYPLFFGLLNVFLSFGRGLLFFTPALVFLFHPRVWRGDGRSRELILASALYLAGITLVYSKYFAWHAGAFWGPRYFLFASVLAAYLLATVGGDREDSPFWRSVWVLLTLASCWVACQGVMFGTDFLDDCYRDAHELEFTCFYVPEYSVLWRFFIVAPPVTGRRVAYLAYFALVAITLCGPVVRQLAGEAIGRAHRAWRELGPASGWKI
jgi:hypothetical protein